MAEWLKVRGSLKSWTKFWCVLKPGLLLLYKSHKMKVVLTVIGAESYGDGVAVQIVYGSRYFCGLLACTGGMTQSYMILLSPWAAATKRGSEAAEYRSQLHVYKPVDLESHVFRLGHMLQIQMLRYWRMHCMHLGVIKIHGSFVIKCGKYYSFPCHLFRSVYFHWFTIIDEKLYHQGPYIVIDEQ
jgi:hypothetical protein